MVYDQGFSSSSSTLEAKLSPSRVDRSSLFPFAFHSPLLSLSSFHSCPHTRNPHAWQPKPSLPSPVPMIYLLPSSSCSLSLSCLSPPFFLFVISPSRTAAPPEGETLAHVPSLSFSSYTYFYIFHVLLFFSSLSRVLFSILSAAVIPASTRPSEKQRCQPELLFLI